MERSYDRPEQEQPRDIDELIFGTDARPTASRR